MVPASVITAWVILLIKAAAWMACTIAMLCLFWAMRSRSLSHKKENDPG